MGAHLVRVGHLHQVAPLLPRHLPHARQPLRVRLPVQGRVGGARHGGHGVGDHRAVGAGREEGQAQGPPARLHQLLHRPQLRGLRRRAQSRLQRRLLRLPRRLPLRRPLLLLPRRPPLPAQRHQLPHLRPQPRRRLLLLLPARPRFLRRRRPPPSRAPDAAAARPPDAPLLRRHRQGRLRRRPVPQDTARRLGRRRGRRRHPRLRHQPHRAGQAGLPRRRGRAQQGSRRAAAGHHGPVRVLLQLDVAVGRGHRRRPAQDGRALRRGGAAGAPREELRDRRGARRQVHRPAGRPLARDLRHREHPAAGAPVGVRHQEPTAKVPEVAVRALILTVAPDPTTSRVFSPCGGGGGLADYCLFLPRVHIYTNAMRNVPCKNE